MIQDRRGDHLIVHLWGIFRSHPDRRRRRGGEGKYFFYVWVNTKWVSVSSWWLMESFTHFVLPHTRSKLLPIRLWTRQIAERCKAFHFQVEEEKEEEDQMFGSRISTSTIDMSFSAYCRLRTTDMRQQTERGALLDSNNDIDPNT